MFDTVSLILERHPRVSTKQNESSNRPLLAVGGRLASHNLGTRSNHRVLVTHAQVDVHIIYMRTNPAFLGVHAQPPHLTHDSIQPIQWATIPYPIPTQHQDPRDKLLQPFVARLNPIPNRDKAHQSPRDMTCHLRFSVLLATENETIHT